MNLLAILGIVLILHSGYWYMKTKKFADKLGVPLTYMPVDVKKIPHLNP